MKREALLKELLAVAVMEYVPTTGDVQETMPEVEIWSPAGAFETVHEIGEDP